MIANFQINEIQESNDQDAAQKLVFYIEGKEQDFRFSLYQAILCHYWRERKVILMSTISCEVSTQITS
jgi:hypothetical protein